MLILTHSLIDAVTRVNNFMLQPLSSLLETLPDEVPSLIEDNFGFREGKVSSPCIIFQVLLEN